MNNQHQHSIMNPVAGSNQRGLATSQHLYQLQQTTNMSQLSHMQQPQQQQSQSHMLSSFTSQKPSDMSSRQYSPSMSASNGSAYQPLSGPSLHSNLNMDNQLGLRPNNETPSHQYNQQHHNHQYQSPIQQQQHHQQQQQQQQQQHHHHHHHNQPQQSPQQHYQSTSPNQLQHHHQTQPHQQHQLHQQLSPHQQHQHLMQQPHQYNMHQGTTQGQQQPPQQQMQQHTQAKPMQQHRQPYVHVGQQRSLQQQQQSQPKYERVSQPRRILQNTNSVNHRHNQRPLARDLNIKKAEIVSIQEKELVPSKLSDVSNVTDVTNKEDEGKENKIEVNKDENKEITDKSGSATENKELANTKEKTPMTLIQELAKFNKIERKYTLLDEQGPAHKKTFYVKLLLGTEEYSSSGASIRKAQQAAAAIALKETNFKHPPEKPAWKAKNEPMLSPDGKLTPTVELNGLAMKRGEVALYKAIEPQQPPYYYPPGMDPRSLYNQRYYHYMRASRDPRYARGYWPMRYHYPRMSRGFYVSLRVGHREFIGDGPTRQAARHNAAIKALKVLKNLPPEKEPSKADEEEIEPEKEEAEDKDSDDVDGLKSRVTSVHEIAFHRKFAVNFEVIRESGPPHMKTFITRCTVGDMVSEGEGNSKKMSKKIAAEQMYEKLKDLAPLPPSAVKRKPKSQVYKKKNRIKAEIQQQKADPNYGVGVNPISRLIQIMCAQKKKEPVYTLVAERGVSCRKEFIMQIEVDEKTCNGSGPNKKLAKRAAAEAMLELLGYNKPTPQPVKSSFKQPSIEGNMGNNGEKKVTFSESCPRGQSGEGKTGIQQKVPGILHLPSKTVVTTPATTGHSVTSTMSSFNSKEPLVNLSNILRPNWRPELQLRELCKALSYPIKIDDFTKSQANNSLEYISQIYVGSNDNQQKFLGTSNSLESARDMACMEALKVMVSRVKDMHPAGDGSHHNKKSVLSRTSSGVRDMPQ